MRSLFCLLLFVPFLSFAQSFTFQSKYQPASGAVGFAFRGEVLVTQTKVDKYKATYSVKLTGLRIDRSGFWVGSTFYNCIEHPEICNSVTDRDFYLAQVQLIDNCNPKGFGQQDFSAVYQVAEDVPGSSFTGSCKPGFPSGIILNVSTAHDLVSRINKYVMKLKQGSGSATGRNNTSRSSGTSASSSSASASAAAGNSTSANPADQMMAPPSLGNTNSGAALQQLNTSIYNLSSALADDIVEARRRREEQRQRQYAREQEQQMRRAAEEARLRKAAREKMTQYELLANRGDAYAMEMMGTLHYEIGEKQKGVEWWERAATAGSNSACEHLVASQYHGEFIGNGSKMRISITPTGLRWLDTLAARGAHEAAMKWIWLTYGNRESGKSFDPEKALRQFERFAQEGNLTAMIKIGNIYSGYIGGDHYEALGLSGNGKKYIDIEKALLYYEMCARAKDARRSTWSLRRMADMYAGGDGVKKDADKAEAYLAQANAIETKLGLDFYLFARVAFSDGSTGFTPIFTAYGPAPSMGGSPEDLKTAAALFKKQLSQERQWHNAVVVVKPTYAEAVTERTAALNVLPSQNGWPTYLDDIAFTFDSRNVKPKMHPFLEANARNRGVTVLPNGIQYQILSAGSGERPTRDGKFRGTNSPAKIRATGMETSKISSGVSWSRKRVSEIPAPLAELLLQMPAGSTWRFWIPFHLIDRKDYDFFDLFEKDFGAVSQMDIYIDKVFN